MAATPPIFISYRIADTAVEARLLFTDLANHFGREAVFLDKKRLEGGMDWPDELDRNVAGAKVLLVLLKKSKAWMGEKDDCTFRMNDPKDWVRLEIEKSKAAGKTIIPILFDGANFPAENALPESLRFLRSKQGEKITTEKWDSGVNDLIKILEKYIGTPQQPVAADAKIDALEDIRLPDDVPDPKDFHESPYLGLQYFERTAARLFFGRRREILEFFKLVKDPEVRLVSLFGHSGVGKSSLLAAGVLPRLEASHCPFYERRRITEQPHGIASQLDRLRREPKMAGKPTVYILDQVEEIFTDPLPGEPQALVESLRKAVSEEPEATIVLGFRSDFQMDVDDLLDRVDFQQGRREDLPIYPLSQNALVEAIEGVANDPNLSKRYRLELEKGFAEFVARNLLNHESGGSAAAILQNRLLKLYQNARQPNSKTRRLTLVDYEELARNTTAEAELLDFQLQRLRDEHGIAADERSLLETLDQFVVDKPTAGTLPKNQLPDDPQQIRAALRRVNLLTELPESQAVRLSHDLLAPVIRARFQQFLLDETERLEIERIRLVLREVKRLLDNIEFEAAYNEFGFAVARVMIPEEVAPFAFEFAFIFLHTNRKDQGFEALVNYRLEIQATNKVLPIFPDEYFLEEQTCATLLDYLRRCDPAFFKKLEKKYFPTMIRVEGGSFDMGDVLGDNEYENELPVHKVTLSTYELAETPTTFWQYGIFCLEKNLEVPSDSGWGRADRPVINVNWEDATTFSKWLSEKTGKNYLLPTEAEWEFAARERGKAIRFGNGKMIADPAEMNFDASKEYKKDYSIVGEYREKTTPVRQFPANALGFYDMAGNVWEWCQDWYGDYPAAEPQTNPKGAASGSYRVLRGGGWNLGARNCRAAYRYCISPGSRWSDNGFRLALSLQSVG